jgi:hypothetical protein
MSKVVEFRNDRFYVIAGWNWKRFGLGINIDRYSLTIDLVWLWVSVEY